MGTPAGWKNFTSAMLSSTEVNDYLMSQTVMVFASAAARTSGLGTPNEGNLTYLKDSNSFWYYDGSSWLNMGNVMVFASSAARATAIPAPVEGMLTWLGDVDELEVYNGTSWLRLVVTSEDEGLTVAGDVFANTGKFRANRAGATSGSSAGGIDFMIDGNTWGQIFMSTSSAMRFTSSSNSFDGSIVSGGAITAANGGADGGIVLRTWTASSAYGSVATRDMTGSEYMLLSDGISTFVSGGGGGSTYIRGGANSTTAQLVVGTDTSYFDGRVRFPSQPAVYAHNSNSYSLTDNQTLRFDVVSINRGSHYNSTNSEFLVPTGGLYYVHCQVLTQNNGSPSDMRIAVNNVRVDAYSGYSLVNGAVSSHKQGHVQGIVSVTTGQYISIKSVGAIDFYGNPSAGHSSLLIHFLG